jgi:hypothetical protein
MPGLATKMNLWTSKTGRGKRIIPLNTEVISQTGKTAKKKTGNSSIEFFAEKPAAGRFFYFWINSGYSSYSFFTTIIFNDLRFMLFDYFM